ncbi:relaxase/mobilization nuclease domain-containing protein, partial [Calidifontibacter indicus]|uniref:relaxase/mobilization nuclease domain-containing protein n=1 Tax=Calidifontibacter indicus TaxID=419650 RepID=UPI003D72A8A5
MFHASMSLPPTHDHLSDEQWQTLAHEYVRRMGFVDDKGHGSSWIAVRHGVSAKGNDHIHVMVNLVRDDGGWSSKHQSKKAADRIGRELEQEYASFLSATYEQPAIEGERRPGLSAFTQAEQRRAWERELSGSGPVDPDRVHLQRVIRGMAM